jgi:Predicted membrane protein (DUF2142)
MGTTSRGLRTAVWLLAAATVLRALVWIVALPPWQGPDEPSHYTYVERILVRHTIPPLARGEPDRFSTAIQVSANSTGSEPYRFHLPVRPLRRDLTGFPSEPQGLSGDSSGPINTSIYPPTYYLLGAVATELPGLHATATARLYAIRVVSALLGGLATILIFRLLLAAGVPDLLSLLGTIAFVQLPMFTQSTAIANPDILLSVGIVGLAASLLRARGDPTRRRLVFVLIWAALTALSKPIGGPTALILMAALLGLGPAGSTWRRRGWVAAAVAAVLAAVVVYQYPAGASPIHSIRIAASYVWQFYLPRLPGQIPGPYANSPELASWSVWLRGDVGNFGWLTTQLPDWAYQLSFGVLIVAVVVAVAGFAFRRLPSPRVAGALLVAAIAYVGLLHLSEVVLLLANNPLLLQGRYLLPIVPLFEAALLLGLARMGRLGLTIGWALVAMTFVLSVQGLDTVLVYFG